MSMDLNQIHSVGSATGQMKPDSSTSKWHGNSGERELCYIDWGDIKYKVQCTDLV